MQGQLAQLFVDITLRGGAKAQLLDMKEKIEASDRALANNAQKYQNVTSGKIIQMSKLAERQHDLAKVDQRTYGKLPYAGYAGKQAKADVETEIASKQKMIALSKAELQALSGKRGAELAQKTLQSERIKKQVEEVKNQQRLVAEHGKLGATIKQTAGLANMAGAMKALGPIWAIIGAAVATAPAASPTHADMLSKSFELLSAQIGTLLLPIVTGLSGALQNMADKIKQITDQIPENAKTTAANTVSGTGWLVTGLPKAIKEWMMATMNGRPVEQLNKPARPATMPASFEQFDQTWRRIQQEVAGRGDLEQKIFDVQMKNLEALNKIAANTAPQNAPPPPPALPT